MNPSSIFKVFEEGLFRTSCNGNVGIEEPNDLLCIDGRLINRHIPSHRRD